MQSYGETFRPLITVHGVLDAPKKPHTDSPNRMWLRDSPQHGGVPCPAPIYRPHDSKESEPALMDNQPRKCKRASKCRHCRADMRVGQLITYQPMDAKPGHIEYWVHAECAE